MKKTIMVMSLLTSAYSFAEMPDMTHTHSIERNRGPSSVDKIEINSASIKAIQKTLKEKGYKTSVTGEFDRETKLALMKFQRAQGLDITGEINKETLAELDVHEMPMGGLGENEDNPVNQ